MMADFALTEEITEALAQVGGSVADDEDVARATLDAFADLSRG
jgi:hypothetical protein